MPYLTAFWILLAFLIAAGICWLALWKTCERRDVQVWIGEAPYKQPLPRRQRTVRAKIRFLGKEQARVLFDEELEDVDETGPRIGVAWSWRQSVAERSVSVRKGLT